MSPAEIAESLSPEERGTLRRVGTPYAEYGISGGASDLLLARGLVVRKEPRSMWVVATDLGRQVAAELEKS